jgi:hypothetical protein
MVTLSMSHKAVSSPQSNCLKKKKIDRHSKKKKTIPLFIKNKTFCDSSKVLKNAALLGCVRYVGICPWFHHPLCPSCSGP